MGDMTKIPPAGAAGPLAGVTVLDLTQLYNGPYATFLLAMAGATVVKIEPTGGEHLRRRGVVGGAALPFAMLNGGKKAVTLNLKSERGRELLLAMADKADVLVENFSPTVLDRLGLGWDVLHARAPRLIYASSSGFGKSGPYAHMMAMDLTMQAMSGIMSITGFPDQPPVKAGPAVCDFLAGVHLYGAVVTALYAREKSGVGSAVEVAMLDAAYVSLSSNLGLHYAKGATAVDRTGNRHGGMAEAPYNVYPTSDGYIAIICVGEDHWRLLLEVMGHEDAADDPRFSSLKARCANIDAVDRMVGAFTVRHDKARLVEMLTAAGVACAPVRDLSEVMNDRHLHERGALRWIDHPEFGRIVVQSSPIRFDGDAPAAPPPSMPLGAANGEVYRDWLGLTDDDLADLGRAGIV